MTGLLLPPGVRKASPIHKHIGLAGVARAAASGFVPLPPIAEITRRLMSGTQLLAGGDDALATTPDYNAYVGFCLMGNGKRLVVSRNAATHTSDAGRAYAIIVNADGTIASRTLVDTLIAPQTNHMDCTLLTLADDRVVLIYTMNTGPGGGDAGNRMGSIHSDDHGVTWSAPAYLGTNGLCGFGGGAAPWAFVSGIPIELGNGDLRVGYYGTLNDASGLWTTRVAGSDDRGATWSDLGRSIALPANESAAEPCLCLLDDGRQYMVIRGGDLNPGVDGERFAATWSEDDWASAPAAPVTVMLNANCRPAVFQTPDLDVVLLGRGSVPGGAFPAPSDQGFFAISHDRGETFPYRGQMAVSRGRAVYGQFAYVGAADTDNALQAVVAQEDNVNGRGDLWLYKFTAPNPDEEDAAALDTAIEALSPEGYWPMREVGGQKLLNAIVAGVDFRMAGDVRVQDGLVGTVPGVKLDIADDTTVKQAFARCTDHASLDITGTAFSIVVFASHDARSDRVFFEKGGIEFALQSNRMSFSEPTAGQVVSNDGVDPFGIVTAADARMYAMTWNGTTAKFYRDGAQFGTDRSLSGALVANASDAYFGTGQNGTAGGALIGSGCGLALFDVVLTGGQIAGIFAAVPA